MLRDRSIGVLESEGDLQHVRERAFSGSGRESPEVVLVLRTLNTGREKGMIYPLLLRGTWRKKGGGWGQGFKNTGAPSKDKTKPKSWARSPDLWLIRCFLAFSPFFKIKV